MKSWTVSSVDICEPYGQWLEQMPNAVSTRIRSMVGTTAEVACNLLRNNSSFFDAESLLVRMENLRKACIEADPEHGEALYTYFTYYELRLNADGTTYDTHFYTNIGSDLETIRDVSHRIDPENRMFHLP